MTERAGGDGPATLQLVYVGDPMCSWCYGFGQSLEYVLRALPWTRLEIVLGGVRAGATDVLDAAGKQFRLGHWAQVEALTGLPFNREALQAREGFVYDTEPVCRAVVLARRYVGGYALLQVMRRLQHAFYVEGHDTTDGETLQRLLAEALRAQGISVDEGALRLQWQADVLRTETLEDFAQARRWGVRSFPALLARMGSDTAVVTDGYLRGPELQALLLARWQGRVLSGVPLADGL